MKTAMTILTQAVALLAIGLIACTANAGALSPYKATYDLTYGGIRVGEAFYELAINGSGGIDFRARVEPRGIATWISSDIVREQSRLRIGEDGALIAQSYEYVQERGGREAVERKTVEFDWPAGQAHTRVNGERRRVAVEPGTVDRMSLQLKVMRNRLRGEDDRVIVYPVIEDHELREYRFEVTGEVRISTSAGEFDTIRLERRHGSRTTIFWSAPALDYLPVRVEQQRSGHPTSRMDLSRITRPGTR